MATSTGNSVTSDSDSSIPRRPPIRPTESHHSSSSNLVTPSGSVYAIHSRTAEERDAATPHATKRTMADHLRKFESLFVLTPQRMRMIVEAFIDTLDKGLQEWEQVVPMFPTWVFGSPTGQEKGDYLALDLGGTNLRVVLVSLQGDSKFTVTQTKFRLTEEQKQEDGSKLFDFCAQCVHEFVQVHLPQVTTDNPIPLGFTFSYPCLQKKIDHGILIRWTKGFGAPNVENHDVVALFRESLKKLEAPVELVAIINDTTGALIASQYVRPRTKIGLILGTGCNAAYIEDIKSIGKLAGKGFDPEDQIAINCEWGAFDSFQHEHLPRTKYDILVDNASNKPGEQSFEKMISGRYLGEIFRLCICDLIDEGVIFLGQNTYKVEKVDAVETAFLSMMESDPTEELLTIVGIFTHYYNLDTTLAERQFFRALARLIGKRAARLSACGIAAIVRKKGYLEDGCEVGADGSLYNKYPGFARRLQEGLVDVLGDKARNITTYHAEDGSGVGAAVIAAMTKLRQGKGLKDGIDL